MAARSNSLFELAEFGVSVWCDELSRDLTRSGALAKMIDDMALAGVTTNPTIFHNALTTGASYEADLEALAAEGKSGDEIYRELLVQDITEACDVLRPVFTRTQGIDGYVSVEVSPELAHDTDGTIAEAQWYHQRVGRPNLFVKIPATVEGVPAIERSIAAGIPINVTLTFSVDRYRQIAEAYLRGLEKLAAEGKDLSRVASVASFFVSRVDSEVDAQLERALSRVVDAASRGKIAALEGKIAVANAKLAFEKFHEIFRGARWESLENKGARVQRCLWASTSTKNPNYSPILYVQELIGGPTVNTMPIKTMQAYLEHGRPEETLTRGLDEARRQIESLAEFGIDYSDVTDNILETQGVQKFSDSYRAILDLVETKRRRVLQVR
jgi:transaldolase